MSICHHEPNSVIKANTSTRKVCHYLQADFDWAAKVIDIIVWEAETDYCVTVWKTYFMQITELCIPHATIKVKRKVPWNCPEIGKKNVLFSRAIHDEIIEK